MGMIATIPVLMAMFKIRKEMAIHREELILSHPISRTRYLMSFVWIGLLNSIVMIILAAASMIITMLFSKPIHTKLIR